MTKSECRRDSQVERRLFFDISISTFFRHLAFVLRHLASVLWFLFFVNRRLRFCNGSYDRF